jgi:hypothetical protein
MLRNAATAFIKSLSTDEYHFIMIQWGAKRRAILYPSPKGSIPDLCNICKRIDREYESTVMFLWLYIAGHQNE